MKLALLTLAAVVVIIGATAARSSWPELSTDDSGVPTARVTRGDVTTDVHAVGELRTPATTTLTTPAVGGQMRILAIKPTGAMVKTDEIVLSLDPSEQQYRLDEQRSLLEEADAEIAEIKATAAAQEARDRVDLHVAQFNLEKAELDVAGNELLGSLEARRRVLTLEEARRRLEQLQGDIIFHGKVRDASMAAALQKQNKSRLMMEDAQSTIAQMSLRAPIDGVVSVRANQEGTYAIEGVPMPDYREGDTISSGRAAADVLDIERLELVARVAETDVTWIRQGQRAKVELNGGVAESASGSGAGGREPLEAAVTSIGGIRSPGYRDTPSPIRTVDVRLQLTRPLAFIRPGLTAQIVLRSEPLQGVLFVPRQAVFDRNGQPQVYLKTGDHFTPTPLKIAARTETAVVVQDLPEGAVVALSDPDLKTQQKREPAGSAAPLNPGKAP